MVCAEEKGSTAKLPVRVKAEQALMRTLAAALVALIPVQASTSAGSSSGGGSPPWSAG